MSLPVELGCLREDTQNWAWDMPKDSRGSKPGIGMFLGMQQNRKPWNMDPDISMQFRLILKDNPDSHKILLMEVRGE